MLHCFLETSLSYSSIIERKEVQRLIMKVGSITMFALLWFLSDLLLRALGKKKALYKYIDFTVEASILREGQTKIG